MSRLIGIVSVALLVIAGSADAKFRGPISGVIETSDGRSLTDVVVQLKCSAQGIQGNVTSELETRIVETGKRFRILWAWAGWAPARGGCNVQVHHPLYVSAVLRAADGFTVDLGVIKLEPYLDVLRQQPSTAVVSPSRPWPFSLLYTHIRHAYSDFALVHPANNRHALAKYADPLVDIFERSVAQLPTSLHDDNPSITKLRQRLVDYQLATGGQASNDHAGLTAYIQAGDMDGVRTLISMGVDLNAWDTEGNSPLHIAAVENHPELITLLLNAGAEIDRQRWGSGDTPLLEAVQHHSDAATLLLLERGADPTYAAWRGPPLQSAVSQNARMPIIDALIAHGAIKNVREPRHLIVVFFAAARSKHKGPTIRRFVDAGIPVDLRDERQQTALMLAAWAGRAESVATLLELGADPHAKDADGITAIDKAQARGHVKVAELLSSLVEQKL
jgi:ankyrin repeat protein